MRITKNLRADQDTIVKFLDVLGRGSAALSGSKHASPGFFIFAHTFIRDYIEQGFFAKEVLLLKSLEEIGFAHDDGPVGTAYAGQQKSRELSEYISGAAKAWHNGDEEARAEVGWAASEYTSNMRTHLDQLKNRLFPLLEQNISPEDEHKLSEGLNTLAFEDNLKGEPDKFTKLMESLEDELTDWRA